MSLTSPELNAAEFPAEEYTGRITVVREMMATEGFRTLLLTSPENIYYLTGLNHQGHFAFTALILPFDGTPILVAREMERPTVEVQVAACEFVGYADGADAAAVCADAVRRTGTSGERVGVELGSMSFPPQLWQRVLQGLPDVSWVDASDPVSEIRAVKSPAEIARLRLAARLSEAGMQAGIAAAGEGVRPGIVAAEVYRAMLAGGSGYPGFVPLIRSSDELLHEHVTWNQRPLRHGQGLFLELSGVAARYHAPLTRLVHVGSMPDRTHESARIAAAGLDAVLAAMKPGAVAADVYAAWQEAVDNGLGHHRYRRHHCGYSVGIGFPPSWVGGTAVVGLRAGSDLVVRAGMSFHVLSWILRQDVPDYTLSDTVLVTSAGGELLTNTPREPRIVG